MVSFGRKILLLFLCVVGLSNCQNKNTDNPTPPTEEDIIELYNLYLSEDWETYIKSMHSCKDKPKDYCEQMMMLHKQHLNDIKKETGGIDKVTIDHIEVNNRKDIINIYLNVTYKNKKTEEILFPIVFSDGKWLVR